MDPLLSLLNAAVASGGGGFKPDDCGWNDTLVMVRSPNDIDIWR